MLRFCSGIKPAACLLACMLLLTACDTAAPPASSHADTSRVSTASTQAAESTQAQADPTETDPSAPGDSTGTQTEGSRSRQATTSRATTTSQTTASQTTASQTAAPTTGTQPEEDPICPYPDVLRVYISGEATTTEEFMPCTAYIVDNRVRDVMFEAFLFQPSPNFLYDGSAENDGMAELTKKDWLHYIHDFEFAEGVNVDALEEAVGETQKLLGKSYKAGVYMSLFMPVKSVTNFGEVDGRSLDFSKKEDRMAAVKWMVDEQIRQFNAKNYQNLEITGFYWFHESIDYRDDETLEVIKYATDYVRSLGYITIWAPFFASPAYDRWKEYGFDLATMQPNYFLYGSPNGGGEERLTQAAAASKRCGIGVEIELEDVKEPSITVTKKYLRTGVEEGYMKGFNTFYISSGPKAVEQLYQAKKTYIRSLYDDMYKFIKNKSRAKDIVIQ